MVSLFSVVHCLIEKTTPLLLLVVVVATIYRPRRTKILGQSINFVVIG